MRAKQIEITAAGLAALGRALPLMIVVQRRLFGEAGSPGGSLLMALRRLDDERADGAKRASRE